MKEYTIDATNQKLGRLSSKVASLLMGKDSANFQNNTVSKNKVSVINASKIDITEKKTKMETNSRYSGYPGGLTKSRWEEIIAKKGMKEVVKVAVSGMLPKNKLRDRMLLNLKITD